MKIAYALILTAFLTVPAFAEENGLDNPMAQLTQMIQCQAVDISLSHLHTQIAASLQALSGPTGRQKLDGMITGYLQMASNEDDKVDAITKLIKEGIAPEILSGGLTNDEFNASAIKLLSKAVADITKTLGDPDTEVDDQVAMEQALVTESGVCETLTVKLTQKHTI